MAWGVMQDGSTTFPPGTVRLSAKEQDQESIRNENHGLKKRGEIVLQPQPSDSPNDPLNWSQSFKIAHILILIAFSGGLNAISVMITPGLANLAEQYNVSPDLASSLTVGSFTFWSSAASFFAVSAASIWGRRPFYIISAVMIVVTNAVAFQFKNFSVLVATRIIMGLASGPLLTSITSSISDIFFVHERGIFIPIWNVSLNLGGQLGPVIGGFIIDSLGMQATFGMSVIIFGPLLLVLYFLVQESLFPRPAGPATEHAGSNRSINVEDWGGVDEHYEDEEDLKASQPEPREPLRSRLQFFRGRLTGSSFWKGVIKPLGFVAYPAVLFSTALFCINFVFIAVLPILTAFLFAQPPYELSPSQIGLTNLPIAAVALIGGPITGWISDVVAKYMARHNRTQPGVFEPEFRLVAILISGSIAAVGLAGFGRAMEKTMPLSYVLVWMSITNLGAMWTTQTTLTFIVDCFPTHSSQAVSAINLFTAIVIFVASGVLVGWFDTAGPVMLFDGLATSSIVVVILTIPIYVYGKRIRSKMARVQWARNLLE